MSDVVWCTGGPRVRAGVAALTLFASWIVCDPAAAQATPYTFTRIAASAPGSSAPASCVAVNGHGTVLFAAYDGTLWTGNGGALTRVDEVDPSGQPLNTVCPGLNDANDVVYALTQTASATTALIKRSGGVATELARGDAAPFLNETSATSIHSLTNGGTTVMRGADGMLYLLPSGTPVYSAGSSTADPSSIVAGTMNENDLVAFYATRDAQGSVKGGIYRGAGTPLVEDGTGQVAIVESAAPVVNNAGVVVFRARFADDSTHVVSTADGISIVDRSGALATSGSHRFSINNAGTVAFAALVNGHTGVFTGVDPVADKVIAPGDALDGSIVVNATIWDDAINDAGQIAFSVELADGRTGVFRATPIEPPQAFDASLDVAFNTPAAGTLTASGPAGVPLTFAITANGSKGVATLLDASTGAFTYTPNANAIGTDAFLFSAAGAGLESAPATITVTIAQGEADNTAPQAFFQGATPPQSIRYDSVADELFRTTDLPSVTGFTAMGWFRFVGDTNAYSSFLRLGHATTSDGYNLLRCCGNGRNQLGIWTGAGLKFGPTMVTGTWYHLAMTVEGSGPGQVKVYSNGELALTFDGSPAITGQRLSIGNDAHLEWMDGNAAAVKIYDVPLTEEEIAREMGQLAPVRTAGLNSWYPLQSAESAATDFSGNGRTLTMTGSLVTEAVGPPIFAAVTTENTPLSGTLGATDPDGNPLTFAIVTNGTSGSAAADAHSGAFTYTPNPNASGADAFSFKANDGVLDSNVASVPIVILPAVFPMSLSVGGGGTGSVKVTPPNSICTSACGLSFQRGTSVSLTATAASGSVFSGWGGDCSGAGTCAISVDGPVAVTATFVVANRDLVTASLANVPAAAAPSGMFPVTVTTTNQGNASAGGSTTRFYLSADAAKSADDLLLSATLLVSTLNAGASATGTVTLTIPATVGLGTYRLLACADDKAVVAESSETNNCLASAPLAVQRPDLVESAVTNPPAAIVPGTTFTVTDTVENRSGVPAGASTTRYYLSADAARSADDLLIAVTRSVPTLAPNASSAGAKTLTVPATTPLGTYRLIACADDLIKVVEGDETNNCTAAAGSMLVGRADLTEATVSEPPAALAPGGTFTITDTAENHGIVAAGASTTRYYLSLNGSKSGAVLLATTRYIASIAAGAASTGSKTVTVPATIALGSYYALACADDLATVPEADETNNCVASNGRLGIGLPDLVIASVSNPPVEIAPGKTMPLTAAVQNNGQTTAAASTTRFYLSTDGTKSANDVLLTGTIAVGTLAAGAGASSTVTVTVPAAAPAGAYLILACADDLAKVAEGAANETNNCTASANLVQVRLPDLVETAVTDPPASAARGGSVTISDTVSNQGAITVGASTTRYYLSVDGTKQSGILLTGLRSIGTLAVGASSTGSRTLTVPATMPVGTYFLLACADDTKVAVESDENNNCVASAHQTSIR